MATPIHRKGEMGSGHGCGWFPRPNNQGSGDNGERPVLAGGIRVHREGDSWESHCDLCQDPPPCHTSTLKKGSSNVMVNGKGCARIGDPVDCGSVAVQGLSSVIVGG